MLATLHFTNTWEPQHKIELIFTYVLYMYVHAYTM